MRAGEDPPRKTSCAPTAHRRTDAAPRERRRCANRKSKRSGRRRRRSRPGGCAGADQPGVLGRHEHPHPGAGTAACVEGGGWGAGGWSRRSRLEPERRWEGARSTPVGQHGEDPAERAGAGNRLSLPLRRAEQRRRAGGRRNGSSDDAGAMPSGGPPAPDRRCPNAALSSAGGGGLPDCRAYEMVSPVRTKKGRISGSRGRPYSGLHRCTRAPPRVIVSPSRLSAPSATPKALHTVPSTLRLVESTVGALTEFPPHAA